jgi:hypothetical protein
MKLPLSMSGVMIAVATITIRIHPAMEPKAMTDM